MKKGDVIWTVVLIGIIAFLLYPITHKLFVTFTNNYAYIAGFLKFAILATMGDLLAYRIVTSEWKIRNGFLFRMFIWGFLGAVIVLIFDIFGAGVAAAMETGSLPGVGYTIAFAFFTSTIMNLVFAPTMMGFHRITDTYADLKFVEGRKNLKLDQVLNEIDWNNFISFIVMKTIPAFWIPAHTITFLLPSEYRVLMAAFLSIALGAILSFAKARNIQQKNREAKPAQ
ncbi:MAG: Mpv17/PMP22 family protein [Candidatus Thermoplasmatota archaeon]|nr:Mpv17/PMP22 family protein [Candidatus Thermoplasmatota archaeon]